MKHLDRLIGVIDLQAGRAVHAVAGQRNQYRSVIATGIEPGDAVGLANLYAGRGTTSFYLADLDAICGREINVSLLTRLASIGTQVFIDAGPRASTVAQQLLGFTNVRYIIPTESYRNVQEWAQACESIGSCRVVMGMDLIGNRLRTTYAPAEPSDQLDDLMINTAPWIDCAVSLGIRSLVVLDLAFVGTGGGPGTVKTCRTIASQWQGLRLISGGGVRDAADVNALVDAGCQQVLVGTALHQDGSAARLLELG